ncbi:MAG: carbohydrate ABC transporter permease [Marvinbryantia sp.]|uniref:carbohydrate ABC transporter permease n=1 Tax=Marvinbryantia sp. TaxID=2496532 RepID=UPI0039995FB8
MSRKKKWEWTPYLLLLPSAVIFGGFVFLPFFKNIYTSLTLTDAVGNPIKFVGFRNYIRILTSEEFRSTILRTFRFALMVGIPSFLIGMVLALAATEHRRGSRIYETMYTIPLVIAAAPASVIWYLIFAPHAGILNYLLGTDYAWLAEPDKAMQCVAIVTIWTGLGMNVIFLLTGFRNVPAELTESAQIDGAGYFSRLYHIVIPIASPQIFFVIFYNLILSFQTFAQIRLLTNGGPYQSTRTLIWSIYEEAFRNTRFDYACVQSVVLFLIVFILTRIQFLFEKKGVNY